MFSVPLGRTFCPPVICFLAGIFAAFLPGLCYSTTAFAESLPSDPSSTWTFMFYDDADFTPASDPLNSFISKVRPSENVNVVILQDSYYGEGRLWSVTEGPQPHLLEELGEINMGLSTTVSDFVNYCKTNYPADRYLMCMYDHGGGWKGACADMTDADYLSMDEINTGLTAADGVDILCFTAPCLMSAIESIYELRNCVDVYIGSEEQSSFAFWRESIGPLCDILDDSSSLTNSDIGEMIIQLIADNEPYPTVGYRAMAATKTSATTAVIEHLNDLATYLAGYISYFVDDISLVRSQVVSMGLGTPDHEIIDLYDFCDRYWEIAENPNILQKLNNIRFALDEAVIASCFGFEYSHAHGVSINFPVSMASHQQGFNAFYELESLDMIDDTNWDEFLRAYYDPYLTASPSSEVKFVTGLHNYPNPFLETTRIDFIAPANAMVRLRVIDISGRLIRTLVNSDLNAGPHSVQWDGYDRLGQRAPSGIYLSILETEGNISRRVMHLLH